MSLICMNCRNPFGDGARCQVCQGSTVKCPHCQNPNEASAALCIYCLEIIRMPLQDQNDPNGTNEARRLRKENEVLELKIQNTQLQRKLKDVEHDLDVQEGRELPTGKKRDPWGRVVRDDHDYLG